MFLCKERKFAVGDQDGPWLEVTTCRPQANAPRMFENVGSPMRAFVGVTSMRMSYSASRTIRTAVHAGSRICQLKLFWQTSRFRLMAVPAGATAPLFESEWRQQ
jgi:hypothetical protein